MEENNYTLEQMREDYMSLKSALEKQEIVSDRLMRETMKTKVRTIRQTVAVSVACAIFVILFSPFAFHYNPVVGASWWFVGGTIILMVFCLYMDWKINKKVQRTDLSSCDLLSFSVNVKKLKEDYKNWLKIAFPLAALWAGWLVFEVWRNTADEKLAIGMIAGVLVGFVIGGLAGFQMNRKVIRTCDDIINQIENN